MYIIFNEKGVGDVYYYAEPLPEEHEKKQYVKIDEKDIPEKEGYTAKAKLVDGELEWEFKKAVRPISAEDVDELKEENKTLKQEIGNLNTVNKANMLALVEVHNRLNALEGNDE